jgi:hypothetical protein
MQNLPSSLSRAAFQFPDARNRMAPFWFWNCAMAPERVRRQVRQMAEAGCGGFFIHPRQGLTLPYLSDEWFERITLAVEEASRYGLQVWLYDEYPYPSGIAGGLVTANHPEFRARTLEGSEFSASGFIRHEFELGRLVCALAYPEKDGAVDWGAPLDLRSRIGVVLTREQFWYWPMPPITTNEKRFMADEGRLVLETELPAGQWRIFVAVEKEFRGFKYYDCFVDPLVPGAAQEFLRLTHDAYAERLGAYFGTTIPGIFTDETEPGYSPEVEKALAGQVRLERDWPALRRGDHPHAREIRLLMRECALRLFHERWEEPIAAWCEQHGLIWSAEKPVWRPSQFWHVHQPATDAGHRRVGEPPEPLTIQLRANHRAAMAAAEQCGTTEVRCENFHSLGWGATLQDQKWATDWLAVQGVNRFTPHAFYATSAGLKKHDAAPSFFVENPYWPHFKQLADYTARLSAALSTGRDKARIALLYPTASLWAGGEEAREARATYEQLMNQLLAAHHIFHPVDAHAILLGALREGGLEMGLTRYKTLLVPPLPGADDTIRIAVEKARAAGLRVIESDWLAQLETGRTLSIRDESGREVESIWAAWREAEGQETLFLANTGTEAVQAQVKLKTAALHWEAWDLETGQSRPFAAESAAGESLLPVVLPALGSLLLIGSVTLGESAVESAGDVRATVLDTSGTWDITLDRPNALRLNRWRAASLHGGHAGEMDDAEWEEVMAAPLYYRDTTKGGWKHQLHRQDGAPVWYRRIVECEVVPEDLQILVENGALVGNWTLFVNGHAIPAAAFAPLEYNGDDKTAAAIAKWFRVGANILAIRVEHAPEMGGLVTPLHLIGEFGLRDRTLVAQPVTAGFNQPAPAGLPHYSGAVTYRRSVDAASFNGATHLELPSGFREIAEVRLNGQPLGVRAWSPYQFQLPSGLSGEVELEVTVTNALLPFYEGQQWDAASHRGQNV